MSAAKGSNALIQQLLKAEEEAEAIVKRAKENRVKRLNEAISAAEKDLKLFSESEEKRLMEEYMKESERDDPHLDELENKTKNHIKEIDEKVRLHKDKLVSQLVAATIDIDVSIPDTFKYHIRSHAN